MEMMVFIKNSAGLNDLHRGRLAANRRLRR
jgi:hypothetical protein